MRKLFLGKTFNTAYPIYLDEAMVDWVGQTSQELIGIDGDTNIYNSKGVVLCRVVDGDLITLPRSGWEAEQSAIAEAFNAIKASHQSKRSAEHGKKLRVVMVSSDCQRNTRIEPEAILALTDFPDPDTKLGKQCRLLLRSKCRVVNMYNQYIGTIKDSAIVRTSSSLDYKPELQALVECAKHAAALRDKTWDSDSEVVEPLTYIAETTKGPIVLDLVELMQLKEFPKEGDPNLDAAGCLTYQSTLVKIKRGDALLKVMRVSNGEVYPDTHMNSELLVPVHVCVEHLTKLCEAAVAATSTSEEVPEAKLPEPSWIEVANAAMHILKVVQKTKRRSKKAPYYVFDFTDGSEFVLIVLSATKRKVLKRTYKLTANRLLDLAQHKVKHWPKVYGEWRVDAELGMPIKK